MCEDKKEFEIVSGNGSNLHISDVSDFVNSEKPKSINDKPKNIIIPKEVKIK